MVAAERRRAGLRRAEPARLELLPAHVGVACKQQADEREGPRDPGSGRSRLQDVQEPTVDAEAVGEALLVGGADLLEALGEDPEPPLDLRRALVALAVPAWGESSRGLSGERAAERTVSRRMKRGLGALT